MNPSSRALISAGILFIVLGLLWEFGSRLPGGLSLGKLPGDFTIEKENFRFYFPLATGILVSLVVSLMLALFRKFFH